jgi:hypothetical protein
MMPPWYKRLGIWLCEKLGHVCLQGGWIHDRHYHRDCSLCGRIVSEPLKVVRLKKHNWFIRLFSKEKRREYKGWKSWEALHRKRSKEPIEVIPMKYEPFNLPPWYILANYTYKNTENTMSKPTPGTWISGYGEIVGIGKVFGVGTETETEPNWTPICFLSRSEKVNEIDVANARLIAAAPEMFTALKMFLEYNDQGAPIHFDTDKIWAQARAAIAKAEGEVIP